MNSFKRQLKTTLFFSDSIYTGLSQLYGPGRVPVTSHIIAVRERGTIYRLVLTTGRHLLAIQMAIENIFCLALTDYRTGHSNCVLIFRRYLFYTLHTECMKQKLVRTYTVTNTKPQ